jgi:PAS domain S-box-containing protein
VDLLSGVTKWSDETFRLFGYKPNDVKPTFEIFLGHVHDDDKEKLREEINLAVTTLDEYERTYRVMTIEGTIKHVNSKLVVTRTEDGAPLRLNGFLLDITEQTKYIQKIEEKNKRLREIAWIQSHGVRAPLARIMGLISLIQNHRDDAEVDNVLSMILQSIEELDTLVRTVVRKTEELPD